MTVSNSISASTLRRGKRSASIPSRWARNATWAADSSPLTYRTASDAASFASACSSSVDLPIPGSPPISTTPPSTSPPPSTRSSSSIPVKRRRGSAAVTSPIATALAAPVAVARRRAAPPSERVSISAFKAPQCGHWPCHLTAEPPQALQTNWVRGFDTSRASVRITEGVRDPHPRIQAAHQLVSDPLRVARHLVDAHVFAPQLNRAADRGVVDPRQIDRQQDRKSVV